MESIPQTKNKALSSFFALVLDELTRPIQDEVPWCMLFANNIVLVDKTRRGVNAKLEIWRDALESNVTFGSGNLKCPQYLNPQECYA